MRDPHPGPQGVVAGWDAVCLGVIVEVIFDVSWSYGTSQGVTDQGGPVLDVARLVDCRSRGVSSQRWANSFGLWYSLGLDVWVGFCMARSKLELASKMDISLAHRSL